MDGCENSYKGFPVSATDLFRCSSLPYVNQPKTLVTSEGYHMTITTKICIKRMDT